MAEIDLAEAHTRIARAAAAIAGQGRLDGPEERQIMDARARALARPPVEAAASPGLELVSFTVGRRHFAVDARLVFQVVPAPEPERIPGAPPVFLGVVNLRGEALPVVDLVMLLTGIPAHDPPKLMLVLGYPQPEIGLAADAVEEIAHVPDSLIRPDGLPEALRASDLVRGAYLREHEARVILDGAALLRDPRLFISAGA